jgi:hypothetical protein
MKTGQVIPLVPNGPPQYNCTNNTSTREGTTGRYLVALASIISLDWPVVLKFLHPGEIRR